LKVEKILMKLYFDSNLRSIFLNSKNKILGYYIGLARDCYLGGECYVLVIVDDFSRYSWVFSWRRRLRLLLMLKI
jgi:hypothetical protein